MKNIDNKVIYNKHIESAIGFLETAYSAGYFDEMDKITIHDSFYKTNYNSLKNEFIAGSYPHNFAQRLDTFARTIDTFLHDSEWNIARQTNTIDSYNDYLKKYSNGKYISEAKKRILELEEELAWNIAKQTNTINSYKEYLQKYSNGKYVKEVEKRIKKLDKSINKPQVGLFVLVISIIVGGILYIVNQPSKILYSINVCEGDITKPLPDVKVIYQQDTVATTDTAGYCEFEVEVHKKKFWFNKADSVEQQYTLLHNDKIQIETTQIANLHDTLTKTPSRTIYFGK